MATSKGITNGQCPSLPVTQGRSYQADQHNGKMTQHSHHHQKLGRRGDPRMHRAVAARLANPKLSLLEALQIGGFNTNPSNDEGGDGVTLSQRKNQLSRRLRLVRQGGGGSEQVTKQSGTTRRGQGQGHQSHDSNRRDTTSSGEGDAIDAKTGEALSLSSATTLGSQRSGSRQANDEKVASLKEDDPSPSDHGKVSEVSSHSNKMSSPELAAAQAAAVQAIKTREVSRQQKRRLSQSGLNVHDHGKTHDQVRVQAQASPIGADVVRRLSVSGMSSEKVSCGSELEDHGTGLFRGSDSGVENSNAGSISGAAAAAAASYLSNSLSSHPALLAGLLPSKASETGSSSSTTKNKKASSEESVYLDLLRQQKELQSQLIQAHYNNQVTQSAAQAAAAAAHHAAAASAAFPYKAVPFVGAQHIASMIQQGRADNATLCAALTNNGSDLSAVHSLINGGSNASLGQSSKASSTENLGSILSAANGTSATSPGGASNGATATARPSSAATARLERPSSSNSLFMQATRKIQEAQQQQLSSQSPTRRTTPTSPTTSPQDKPMRPPLTENRNLLSPVLKKRRLEEESLKDAAASEEQYDDEEKGKDSVVGTSVRSISLVSKKATKRSIKTSKAFQAALGLYLAESASLLKRCMVQGGFELSETDEYSTSYLEFATSAVDAEGQRIRRLRSVILGVRGGGSAEAHQANDCADATAAQDPGVDDSHQIADGTLEALSVKQSGRKRKNTNKNKKHISGDSGNDAASLSGASATTSDEASVCSSAGVNHHGMGYKQKRRHEYNFQKQCHRGGCCGFPFEDGNAAIAGDAGRGARTTSRHESPTSANTESALSSCCGGHGGASSSKEFDDGDGDELCDGKCFNGRHVHRLMGKCGHKAIIHRPKGGPAHVDFVVDGKVECYENIQPIDGGKDQSALWPSRYRCAQLQCRTGVDDPSHEVKCKGARCSMSCNDLVENVEPKEIEMSSLDLTGNEWNSDFFDLGGPGDETFLGLIRLGDS